jgi:hypothetical protein
LAAPGGPGATFTSTSAASSKGVKQFSSGQKRFDAKALLRAKKSFARFEKLREKYIAPLLKKEAKARKAGR